jgi:hypothetical protein
VTSIPPPITFRVSALVVSKIGRTLVHCERGAYTVKRKPDQLFAERANARNACYTWEDHGFNENDCGGVFEQYRVDATDADPGL